MSYAFVWFMSRVCLLFFPPDCFTSDAKVPLRMFDLDIFDTSFLWDTWGENESSLILIDPAGGRSFRIGLLLGRVGFHGS